MKCTSVTTTEAHVVLLRNWRRFLGRYGELVALVLLIVLVSLINTVWVVQDTPPEPVREANAYLIQTLQFVDRLKEGGGVHQLLLSTGRLGNQGRPPLYQLLSVPFIWPFGRSADALISINVVFGAILLLATYGIGRLVWNGKAGLLAAFLVATYPPIVHLFRIYMPHSAIPACVAVSLWLLLLLLKTRAVKTAWLFGASLGFGMLIHVNFPFALAALTILFGLYMLLLQTNPRRPPSLMETSRWLLNKSRDPFVLYGLLPAALIAAGLTAIWYVPASPTLYAVRQRTLAVGWGSVTRGFPGVSHSFWWYALTAYGGLSTVFTGLLAISLVAGAIGRQRGVSALVVVFLIMYCSFALRPGGVGWGYFAGALPVAAVLTAVWVVGIRNKLLSTGLAVVCIGVGAFNFSFVTWGEQPWSEPIARALGAQLDSPSLCIVRTDFCPNPPLDEDWRMSDVLRVVLDDAECQECECRLVIIPLVLKFRPTAFTYHLVRDFAESHLWVGGITPQGPDQSLGLDWLLSDYLVYIPQWSEERPAYASAVTLFLKDPPGVLADAYQEVASFALPRGYTARLVKRTKPLTADEARLSVEALDLPAQDKSQLLSQIGPQGVASGKRSTRVQVPAGLIVAGLGMSSGLLIAAAALIVVGYKTGRVRRDALE
jgi:hypothetical protein